MVQANHDALPDVDTFQPPDGNFPSLKWYFITSVPLMLIVMIIYIVLKNSLSIRREDPLRRGTYENIFTQFAAARPELWSRNGPRKYMKTRGPISWLKWHIICLWFDPSRTLTAKPLADIEDMGLWARIKHKIARRWLSEITLAPGDSAVSLIDSNDPELGDFGAVSELVALSAPVAMADGDPRGAAEAAGRSSFRRALLERRSRSRSSSGGSRTGFGRSLRPQSPSSAVMVCEESTDDEETRAARDERERERANLTEREARRRERDESPTASGSMALLSVPMTLAKSSEHAP